MTDHETLDQAETLIRAAIAAQAYAARKLKQAAEAHDPAVIARLTTQAVKGLIAAGGHAARAVALINEEQIQ